MAVSISTVRGGLYLVIDPAKGLETVLPVLEQAIHGGVDIIQLWNHWLPGQDQKAFINAIVAAAHQHQVPVLINEEWQWLAHTALDGVHFDTTGMLSSIRQQVNRPFIAGVTCGNDLHQVKQAIAEGFDYLSFCAMFPSSSAGSCELVAPATVWEARRLTTRPIFVSGGITPQNIQELSHTGIDGVAVISGIMSADDPRQKARDYKQSIQQINVNYYATITDQ